MQSLRTTTTRRNQDEPDRSVGNRRGVRALRAWMRDTNTSITVVARTLCVHWHSVRDWIGCMRAVPENKLVAIARMTSGVVPVDVWGIVPKASNTTVHLAVVEEPRMQLGAGVRA